MKAFFTRAEDGRLGLRFEPVTFEEQLLLETFTQSAVSDPHEFQFSSWEHNHHRTMREGLTSCWGQLVRKMTKEASLKAAAGAEATPRETRQGVSGEDTVSWESSRRPIAHEPTQDGRAVHVDLARLVDECTRAIMQRPRDGSPPMVALNADVLREVAQYGLNLVSTLAKMKASAEIGSALAELGPLVGGDGAADAWGSVIHPIHVDVLRRGSTVTPNHSGDSKGGDL